jgi:hypothetical protein
LPNHREADHTQDHGPPYKNDHASPLSSDYQDSNYQSGSCSFHHFEANDNDAAYYDQADN